MGGPRADEPEAAIMCALKIEYEAVALLVDEWYDDDSRSLKAPNDTNTYLFGRMGDVDIVLIRLAESGKVGAGRSAASLQSIYPGLKILLLTGICGGVPSSAEGEEEEEELLLGDVIIGTSMVPYDNGKRYDGGFEIKKGIVEDGPSRLGQGIRQLLAYLEMDDWRAQFEDDAAGFLDELQAKAASGRRRRSKLYKYPGAANDRCFAPGHLHKHHHPSSTGHAYAYAYACATCRRSADSVCSEARNLSCEQLGCGGGDDDDAHTVRRQRREQQQQQQAPAVHFGCVGSADTVMKSAGHRDALAKAYNIVGFEMEAAGVWGLLPCLVVKGVSDYADGHKNDTWQGYAAAAAAAAAKTLLTQHGEAMLDSPGNSSKGGGQSAAAVRARRPQNAQQRTAKYGDLRAEIRCYRCDWDNHILPNCYARDSTVAEARRIRRREKRCENCGGDDHHGNDCSWEDLR